MTIVLRNKTKSASLLISGVQLKGTAAKLAKLVQETIAANPFEYDCLQWMRTHQEELAKQLGVNRKTINRVISKAPFKSLVINHKEHGRLTLLRIGNDLCLTDRQRILHAIWNEGIPRFNAAWRDHLGDQIEKLQIENEMLQSWLKQGPSSPEKQAFHNEMAANKKLIAKLLKKSKRAAKGAEKIITIDAAKKAGKKVPKEPLSSKDYGCLCGLAEDWGKFAPELLHNVLTFDGWANFMAAVKSHIDETEGFYRYYDLPSLAVIRRFWFIALEIKLYDLQFSGDITAQEGNELNLILAKMKQDDAVKLANKQAKIKDTSDCPSD